MSENASHTENKQYKEVNIDEVPLSPVEHWFIGSTSIQKDNPYKPEGISSLSEQEIMEMNKRRQNSYFGVKFLGSTLGIFSRARVAIVYGQIDPQSRQIIEKPVILGVLTDTGDIDETEGPVLTKRFYDYYKGESPDYYDQLMSIGQGKQE